MLEYRKIIVRLAGLLMAVVGARLAAAEPALLKDAIQDLARGRSNWAYTETTVLRRSSGQASKPTIVRVDPSRPFDQQRIPLEVEGRPPSRADLAQYQELGKKKEEPSRLALGQVALLNNALVVAQDGDSVTYLVPLRKFDDGSLPADKFKVLMRVSRRRHALEHVSVVLQKGVRKDLIAAANAADVEIDFASPDPRYGTLPVAFHGSVSGSVLFFHLREFYDTTISDIHRVSPFTAGAKLVATVSAASAAALDF